MVEPIAFSLKDDKIWKNEKLNQIEYWYWSSIFSGNTDGSNRRLKILTVI